jgi:hypothetical protein
MELNPTTVEMSPLKLLFSFFVLRLVVAVFGFAWCKGAMERVKHAEDKL